MHIYKDKQYLVFDIEGKKVKYDFATKQAIGFNGKPVKNLKSQLSGYSIEHIMDCCDDPQYAKFLRYVRRRASRNGYPISNIGTILERVPRYASYEQVFSAGFEDIVDDYNFTLSIREIPKSLIKIAKGNSVRINDRIVSYWEHNPNAHYIAYNLEYVSLTPADIYHIWSRERFYSRQSYFNHLLDEYGYNAKSLFLYLDYLKTHEALENMQDIIKELYDYAYMMKLISDKFDRYPKNFLTTHRIACRNYNRLKQEFSEELFKKRIIKGYECSIDDYKFIYPSTTQDIKDEAVQQNNCVASYINRVLDGKCHIMFLRKKEALDKSLITLEIVDNRIVQAKGKFNRDLTENEQNIVNKWNKKYEKEKVA